MSNPIIQRLAQIPTSLSPRRCLWAAFGLGLLSLAGSAWVFLHVFRYSAWPELLVMAVAGLFTLLTPVLVAILAALIARRSAAKAAASASAMTSATSLPDSQIVQGYVVTALYQVRGPLILVAGLMPALVVLLMKLSIDVIVVFSNVVVVPPGEENLYGPQTIVQLPTVWNGLAQLLVVIGLWGFIWLAAALGVMLGLWPRTRMMAAIVAPLAVVVLLMGILIATLALATGYTALALVVALPAWSSYPAAMGVMRVAERWACPNP